jgi:methylenetetrahydrofolate reductase (NADPH)
MTLESKIKSGEFAVIGEFEPPKGADLSSLINNANRVRGRIDAFLRGMCIPPKPWP